MKQSASRIPASLFIFAGLLNIANKAAEIFVSVALFPASKEEL